MGLTAKDPGGSRDDFDPTPEGLHPAIAIGVYDLGTQYSEKFGKSTHRVLLMWELPECRIEIEKAEGTQNLPRAISRQYTLSLHQNALLRQHLEMWRGRAFSETELVQGFNLKKLLGVNCTLQVIHNKGEERTFANVSAVMPLMKGKNRKPENPLRFFSFEDGKDIPEGTPEWIAKIINEAEEARGVASEPVPEFEEGEIPDEAPPF